MYLDGEQGDNLFQDTDFAVDEEDLATSDEDSATDSDYESDYSSDEDSPVDSLPHYHSSLVSKSNIINATRARAPRNL